MQAVAEFRASCELSQHGGHTGSVPWSEPECFAIGLRSALDFEKYSAFERAG